MMYWWTIEYLLLNVFVISDAAQVPGATSNSLQPVFFVQNTDPSRANTVSLRMAVAHIVFLMVGIAWFFMFQFQANAPQPSKQMMIRMLFAIISLWAVCDFVLLLIFAHFLPLISVLMGCSANAILVVCVVGAATQALVKLPTSEAKPSNW